MPASLAAGPLEIKSGAAFSGHLTTTWRRNAPVVYAIMAIVGASWLLVRSFGLRSVRTYVFILLLSGILLGAWAGYWPGILTTLVMCFPSMYLLVPNFSVAQTKWGVVAALLLLAGVVSRLSEARQLRETTLRKTNETLDMRVTQRTAELEQANAALADQLAQLETLYQQLSVGVAFFDTRLCFERLNEKFADFCRRPKVGRAGAGLRDVIPPAVADVIEPLFRRVLETGVSCHNYELRSHDNGTAERCWLIDCSPVTSNVGAALGLQAIVQDISERKAVETALCRANEDLAQFAYVAAHDLQEPLRTVIVFSQLLQRRYAAGLGTEAQHLCALVVEAATRMSRLIADVLRYSLVSSEANRASQAVNLEEIMTSVLVDMEAVIEDTQAQIVRDPLPTVQGDPTKLGQVLHNLLGNSIKFHRLGVRPEIEVKVNRGEREWTFSVRDNGKGFNGEYAAQVFGVFKRLQGPEVPGSGIGLAICKTVIESHGGKVWAESQENMGATFYFTLPALKCDNQLTL